MDPVVVCFMCNPRERQNMLTLMRGGWGRTFLSWPKGKTRVDSCMGAAAHFFFYNPEPASLVSIALLIFLHMKPLYFY